MKKLEIYVDTSVLGGCFEPEFATWSNGLIADFRAGTFTPVLSALLETELRRAPVTAVNLEQGYKALSIHSPREVTTRDRDSNSSR